MAVEKILSIASGGVRYPVNVSALSVIHIHHIYWRSGSISSMTKTKAVTVAIEASKSYAPNITNYISLIKILFF